MNKQIKYLALIFLVSLANQLFAGEVVIPEKYKKESVVMTYINIEETYDVYGDKPEKKGTFNNITVSEFEVYLADRSAVQEYESFYFDDPKTLELKIIKKDGKEIEVDLSEAVEVSKSAEISFLSRRSITTFSFTEVQKKIAMSNLEIGDRLYVKINLKSEKELSKISGVYTMDTYDKYLQESYPVLKKTITIKADRKLCFNYKLYNTGKLNPETTKEDNYMVFTLEAKNLDPFKSESFVYKENIYPALKYDIMYVNPKVINTTLYNTNQPGVINEGYDNERLINYGYALYNENKKNAKKVLKNKDLYKSRGTTESYLEKLYNGFAVGPTENRSDMKYQTKVNFLAYFSNAFVKNKIDFQMGFAFVRTKGDIKNALWHYEFEPFFLVKDFMGQEYYIFNPNKYQQWNSMEVTLDNCEAYLVSFNKKRELMSINNTRLPELNHETNRVKYDIKAVIGDSCNSIKIEEKQTAVGYLKHVRLNNSIHSFKKSLEEIDEIMDKANLTNESNSIFINNQKLLELLIEENRLKRVESKHYNFKFEEFNVLEQGKENDNDEHIFVDKYELLDYPTPVGADFYAFRLNRIMPSFSTIDPEELLEERTSTVFFHSKRSIEYNIQIKVPKGFEFVNPDDFNLDIKNEFTNFNSGIKKNGDNEYSLVILYNYLQNEISAKQWNDYVQSVQAIYDLSLQKVILKKVSSKI